MQNVSKAYKQSMKGIGRNRGYIKATIGVINSEAQKHIEVDEQSSLTYFSDSEKPFNSAVSQNANISFQNISEQRFQILSPRP